MGGRLLGLLSMLPILGKSIAKLGDDLTVFAADEEVHTLVVDIEDVIKNVMLLGTTLFALGGAGIIGVSKVTNTQVVPQGGGATTNIQVVAREAGNAYNVLAFCNDPVTTVGKVAMTDAVAGGDRYIAQRAQEDVNWPDSPVGQNDAATHHWVNTTPGFVKTDGTIAALGAQLSEPVTMTKDAADCFKKKAK